MGRIGFISSAAFALSMLGCDHTADIDHEPKFEKKLSTEQADRPHDTSNGQQPEGQDPQQKGDQDKTGHEPDPDAGDTSKPDKGTLLEPEDLPSITGKCPDMTKGGSLLFRAKGMNKHRLVQVWTDPNAKGKNGPLIFYWHGTGMNPGEALLGLGPLIDKVTSMGGAVVAPFRDPESGIFPWYLVLDLEGKRLDDLLLADEVLACAREQIGINTRQIHTLGLSAGGLQSTQMSYRRSNYIASSVQYSGGLVTDPPPSKEPRNRFSSMIFHGGPADIVVVPFALTSERYLKALLSAGHFGFMCDHLTGHIIPPGVSDSVWTFFMDHPFGSPSPYKGKGLPKGFPAYCKMPAP